MKNAYFKYIFALLLFGSNGIVASYIPMSSHEIVLLRTLVGSLFLITAFLLSGKGPREKGHGRDTIFLAVSGMAMGGSWMFLYEAYSRIGVSVATLAYYCGPVIVLALAPMVFREKITRPRLLGFGAVLLGMLLVNGRELSHSGFSWGLLCGVLSAVLYAVMVIFNKKATGITGLKNAVYQLCAAFLTVGLFTLIRQGVSLEIAPGSILPILILGIVNTGFGCYLFFSSIPRLPAQSVAVLGYMEPVSALILSSVFLRERLTLLQLAGTACILGGAAFGELYRHRRPKKDAVL